MNFPERCETIYFLKRIQVIANKGKYHISVLTYDNLAHSFQNLYKTWNAFISEPLQNKTKSMRK